MSSVITHVSCSLIRRAVRRVSKERIDIFDPKSCMCSACAYDCGTACKSRRSCCDDGHAVLNSLITQISCSLIRTPCGESATHESVCVCLMSCMCSACTCHLLFTNLAADLLIHMHSHFVCSICLLYNFCICFHLGERPSGFYISHCSLHSKPETAYAL